MRRLQGGILPHARYSLGRSGGAVVNIIGLIYITPIFILSFFPPVPNPTPGNMNWACVMVGGVVLFATIYYIILGRKQYTPPPETVEDYIRRDQNMSTPSEKEVSRGLTGE
jgi:choline transport protein